MSNPPAIQTAGLTRHFRNVVAIDNLDLTVEQGEIFGFLGPNGAGKTTTVKLLLGLIRPTSGEIRVLGQSMPEHAREVLPRVGAMVEAPAFYPFLSGRDNLIALTKMSRISEREADQALARVGLDEAARRSFKSYSVGMKQRLAIAAALMRKPELVLLDEPTTGLDPAGQREIRALIPQLARDGCTVFLSSHMMQEVQEICDRAGFLRDGRLIRTAPVDQLIHAGVAATFEITTDNPALCLEILSNIEWVTAASLERGKLVISTSPDRASSLNRALAERGVFASEIHQRERSLEDAFFETMEEKVA